MISIINKVSNQPQNSAIFSVAKYMAVGSLVGFVAFRTFTRFLEDQKFKISFTKNADEFYFVENRLLEIKKRIKKGQRLTSIEMESLREEVGQIKKKLSEICENLLACKKHFHEMHEDGACKFASHLIDMIETDGYYIDQHLKKSRPRY